MHPHPPETVLPAPPSGAEADDLRADVPVWRRRLLWIGSALLLLALLILTPPLVNANQYRGKIAESMSKSLGRPVHLDNVSLHLLPTPGFTLQNLVVSEDPAFGAEPTIRANTVEATLRVSSLWHRPVEFSRVRFVEPSVNLVRDAGGRWNLSDVLLNASHVESAPTSQRKAGPKPRFPYIEATGGRVNIKIGQEKLPFSLTDADFALWLPSPQQWRVRLIGHPARTDTYITDPGRVRIEGELRHAATAAAVPVDFHASWHDAPLGEVTQILNGDDWGWRGSMNLDATLTGTLGDARMASKLTLGGLRRAEFFPAQPLDLQVTCGSGFTLHPATLSTLRCSLPDDAPEPLTLTAEAVHLQGLGDIPVSLKGNAIPVRWALLWASLYSRRVPTDLPTTGTVDVDLARGATVVQEAPGRLNEEPVQVTPPRSTSLATQRSWTGVVRLALPAPGGPGVDGVPATNVQVWNAMPAEAGGRWPALHLPATPTRLGPDAAVTLAGDLAENGYSFTVDGSAPAAALLQPARYLPPLMDGLETVLPAVSAPGTPVQVQFTCTRHWASPQSCVSAEGGEGERTSPKPGRKAAGKRTRGHGNRR